MLFFSLPYCFPILSSDLKNQYEETPDEMFSIMKTETLQRTEETHPIIFYALTLLMFSALLKLLVI